MRKIFNHNLVDEIPLGEEYIDGKRHYVLPDGKKFRSVTTVLSQNKDMTHLLEWKKRVGEEEAKKIITQASRRGTAVHSIAEKYVLNKEDYAKGAMPSGLDSFNSLKQYLDKHVDNIYGIELPLHSVGLRTAGRCDMIAEFDGVSSIIDFKTSRKLKREDWITDYFLQTTCYSMMFEWMYKIEIPQIVVMIAVDDELPQLFVKNRKNYVQKVIDIFTAGK
jgi:genome maintenance exonuclease 1